MEDNELYFSTGDMARHLGMTSQGLRWYESKGLINPEKGSSYRKYSVDDFCVLSRVRFYHQSGFSIEEIESLINADEQTIATNMDEMVEDSRLKIEAEKVKLSILEAKADALRTFNENEGVQKVVDTDATFFVSSVKSTFVGQRVDNARVKRWASALPFAQYISITDYHDKDAPSPIAIGISLAERFCPYIAEEIRADIEAGNAQFFPSRRALYGTIQFSSATSREEGFDWSEIFSSRDDLENVVVRRPITCRKEGENVITYWEFWIPFKV